MRIKASQIAVKLFFFRIKTVILNRYSCLTNTCLDLIGLELLHLEISYFYEIKGLLRSKRLRFLF